jgi:hypothetical protein
LWRWKQKEKKTANKLKIQIQFAVFETLNKQFISPFMATSKDLFGHLIESQMNLILPSLTQIPYRPFLLRLEMVSETITQWE